MSVVIGRLIRVCALALTSSLALMTAPQAREPGDPPLKWARPAAGAKAPAAAPHPAAGKPAADKPAAAKPTKSPDDEPMVVQLVRDATPGCEPSCLEWVSAQGKIVAETRARFITVLGKLGKRRVPIFVDSGGGQVDAALAIARQIRAKGFDVVVTKTALAPCAEGDAACRKLKASGIAQGRPQAKLAKCLSSCAFILAGGVNRLVGWSSFVGVHQVMTLTTISKVRQTFRVTRSLFSPPQKQLVSEQVVSQKTVRSDTPDSTYDKIDRFFAEMGIDRRIMKLINETPNEKMHLLTAAELQSTRIMTARINGEDLVAARTGGAPVTTPRVEFPGANPQPLAGASVFLPPGAMPVPAAPPATSATPPH